ncbi:MAG: hypothetical protein ACFFDT_40315, partial [Candidatus Hodarchaeota archaeon]
MSKSMKDETAFNYNTKPNSDTFNLAERLTPKNGVKDIKSLSMRLSKPEQVFEESNLSDEADWKEDRWQLGSVIAPPRNSSNDKKYAKLALIHHNISSNTGLFHSRTVRRNIEFAVKLQQWFPVALLDETLTELHRTDRAKIFGDENVVARILGYLECALRIRCRTIPWKTIWEINNELGMNLTKRHIFDCRFKALKAGAFSNGKSGKFNRDTFNVMRGKIAALTPSLPINDGEKPKILMFAKKLCAWLEARHIVPKDPEVYSHAIVEIAYKKVTGKRNLVTTT